MLRPSAALPIIFAIAGFILSLLVLLAGFKENFLPSIFVLQVDTTNLGANVSVDVESTIDTLGERFGISSDDPRFRFIRNSNLTDRIEDVINNNLPELIDTAASRIGVFDIYTAHVMTFCEGVVAGDERSNYTVTTGCTNPEIPFAFDPVARINEQLRGNLTLEQLGIDTAQIEDVLNALQRAYEAMSVLYVIGVALAGLSIILGIVGFFASRIIEVINGLVAFLAFLCLGVASAIGTALAIRGRDVFNDHARDAGVVARHSNQYLGLTWGAVAAMLLATLWWFSVCCCGRHHKKNNRMSTNEPLVEKRGHAGPVAGRRRFIFFGRRRAVV